MANTPKRWHDVEALVCALDVHLAKMEAGEPSAETDAARTARRANHALIDALALADLSADQQAHVDRFTAEHGRPPSWFSDKDDWSNIPL